MHDNFDNTQHPRQKIYKSPISKLLKFFENSRDRWKVKCQKAKYMVKLLKNKIRNLEQNKEDLKRKLKELENELEQRKIKENQMEKEINELKKNL